MAKSFHLEIACDNAAFEENEGREVARILQVLVHMVSNGFNATGESGAVRDGNGNKVGKWDYKVEAAR